LGEYSKKPNFVLRKTDTHYNNGSYVVGGIWQSHLTLEPRLAELFFGMRSAQSAANNSKSGNTPLKDVKHLIMLAAKNSIRCSCAITSINKG